MEAEKMDTYRVYLVDDEPWALVYLEKIVKWEDLGFRITGKFENSMEAFNQAVSDPPDVIFIDIRMPEMDGLSFMRKAVEAGLPCRFVVISGFAEFSYAQEAIRMGVVCDYCLKPIARDKLTALLGKLHLILEEQKEKQQEKEEIPLTENPVFQELLTYMHGHFQEKLVLKELAEQFHLNANYCCALFNRDAGGSFSEYLTSIRMKEAERLLTHTTLSLEEIAVQCGIQDYYYFNKVFKKYSGATPSQYRKQRKNPENRAAMEEI